LEKRRNIVDTADAQEKVLQLVFASPRPVTVGFVAFNLGVQYQTARALLLILMAQGRINGERSTRSWTFKPVRKKSEVNSLLDSVRQYSNVER